MKKYSFLIGAIAIIALALAMTACPNGNGNGDDNGPTPTGEYRVVTNATILNWGDEVDEHPTRRVAGTNVAGIGTIINDPAEPRNPYQVTRLTRVEGNTSSQHNNFFHYFGPRDNPSETPVSFNFAPFAGGYMAIDVLFENENDEIDRVIVNTNADVGFHLRADAPDGGTTFRATLNQESREAVGGDYVQPGTWITVIAPLISPDTHAEQRVLGIHNGVQFRVMGVSSGFYQGTTSLVFRFWRVANTIEDLAVTFEPVTN